MQEKSVILQCLRYIVDNNFFGKDQPSQEDQKVEVHIKEHDTEKQEPQNVTMENCEPEDHLIEDHKEQDGTITVEEHLIEHPQLGCSTEPINQDVETQEKGEITNDEDHPAMHELEKVGEAESIEKEPKTSDPALGSADVARLELKDDLNALS